MAFWLFVFLAIPYDCLSKVLTVLEVKGVVANIHSLFNIERLQDLSSEVGWVALSRVNITDGKIKKVCTLTIPSKLLIIYLL